MERVLKLSAIDAIASVLGRYGLVVVIGWIGASKFAKFEAHQIQPLAANSPFTGWLYDFLPVYTFSACYVWSNSPPPSYLPSSHSP